jgi:hypothetical protein
MVMVRVRVRVRIMVGLGLVYSGWVQVRVRYWAKASGKYRLGYG